MDVSAHLMRESKKLSHNLLTYINWEIVLKCYIKKKFRIFLNNAQSRPLITLLRVGVAYQVHIKDRDEREGIVLLVWVFCSRSNLYV